MDLNAFARVILIPAGPAVVAGLVFRSHVLAALTIAWAVFLSLQLLMAWRSRWRVARAKRRLVEIGQRKRQLRVQR